MPSVDKMGDRRQFIMTNLAAGFALAAVGSLTSANICVGSVDIYAAQFATQVSAPRPVMSAQPAAALFYDVNLPSTSEQTVHATVSPSHTSKGSSGAAAEETRTTSSGKSAKNVTLGQDAMVTPPTGPTFAVTGGWDSTYWWHGEDNVAKATGATSSANTSGVWYGRVSMEWKGFAAYAGYLQSTEKVLPRDKRFGKKYYGETQLGASYTVGLIKDLDLTVGYNAFFFSSTSFLGHSYQGEAFARAAYHGIPFITPSLSAFYLHTNTGSQSFGPQLGGIPLTGWMYEARLDGNFKVFNFGDGGSVTLNPYVTLLYDDGYWSGGKNSEFHNVDYGLNIPIVINKSLVLNLHGGLHSSLISRTTKIYQPDFVGGVSLTYKF